LVQEERHKLPEEQLQLEVQLLLVLPEEMEQPQRLQELEALMGEREAEVLITPIQDLAAQEVQEAREGQMAHQDLA
jgi:hypothetical protein